MTELHPSFDDLQGVWQNAELHPHPDPGAARHHARFRFTFAGGDWCLDFAAFAAPDGEEPLFAIRTGGTYALGGSWRPVPGARRLDLRFSCRYLTAFAPPVLAALHDAGYPAARAGQRTDVTQRGALFVPSLAEAPVEYDVIGLRDGELRLGARTGRSARPEDRPHELQPFGLRRVDHWGGDTAPKIH